jgi:hypothetical protein
MLYQGNAIQRARVFNALIRFGTGMFYGLVIGGVAFMFAWALLN